MNDYLKTHACAVLPLVFASYKVNGNLKLLKKDKEYSLLIMDAMSAKEEFILLNSEFEKLKKKSKLETKAYDKLKLGLLNYKD